MCRVFAAVRLGQGRFGDEACRAPDAELVRRARAIHDRVITLDTHNDIEPETFTGTKNYTQRLDTQVNLPKMIEGGLDASFFIVYVGQPDPKRQPDALSPAGYDRAYTAAVAKFDAIHRLTEQIAPDTIGLALTADDVRRIAASGLTIGWVREGSGTTALWLTVAIGVALLLTLLRAGRFVAAHASNASFVIIDRSVRRAARDTGRVTLRLAALLFTLLRRDLFAVLFLGVSLTGQRAAVPVLILAGTLVANLTFSLHGREMADAARAEVAGE